jgi:hypothetical protein
VPYVLLKVIKTFRLLFFSVLFFSSLFCSQAHSCSHDQAHLIEKVQTTNDTLQSDAHSQMNGHSENSESSDDCDCGGCRTHCCTSMAVIAKAEHVIFNDESASALFTLQLEQPANSPFLDGPFQPPRS